jgi:hypothetical protein
MGVMGIAPGGGRGGRGDSDLGHLPKIQKLPRALKKSIGKPWQFTGKALGIHKKNFGNPQEKPWISIGKAFKSIGEALQIQGKSLGIYGKSFVNRQEKPWKSIGKALQIHGKSPANPLNMPWKSMGKTLKIL